ncbi:MAG: hypothetical protein ACYS4W_11865, partial [Planctomycetota bacterium]
MEKLALLSASLRNAGTTILLIVLAVPHLSIFCTAYGAEAAAKRNQTRNEEQYDPNGCFDKVW